MMASPFNFDVEVNPNEAENLVSSELMRLSINDRNAILEEIHGVGCRSPKETPELLAFSLSQLTSELNQISNEIGKAYRQSQKLPKTYVNTIDFRLRFLRCDLFDAKKAAFRMANFLNLLLEYYGEYALERPIRMSDMTKEELKYMRRGRYQWLPFRDRSGRKIVIVFPGKGLFTIPQRIKAKLAIYTVWTAGNDIDTQLKGIVVIIWFDKSFELLKPENNKTALHEVLTIRVCACHVCTPDTPMYRFRRAVVTMRVANLRMKLRSHVGNLMELSYILQGYGIPTDTLPITYSGTVKVQAQRQWMRLCNFLEEPLYQNTEEIRSVVECPYTNDIVFRQGTSILSHPGNVNFRAMIASKFNQIEKRFTNQNKCGEKSSQKPNDINKKIIVMDVIEEMQRLNLRVLNWDDKQGCWKVLNDMPLIYSKVEYLVREHKKSVKALKNQNWVESSTSMFRSPKDSRRCDFSHGESSLVETNGSLDSSRTSDTSVCFGMKFFEYSNANKGGPT